MKIWIFLSLAFLLLIGCTVKKQLNSTATLTIPNISPSPATTQIKTGINTLATVQPLSIGQITQEPSLTNIFLNGHPNRNENVEVNCFPQFFTALKDVNLAGTITYQERDERGDHYFLDLEAGDSYMLGSINGEAFSSFSTSSNRKRLSYEAIQISKGDSKVAKRLMIWSGIKNKEEFDIDSNWGHPHWLNNEELLFVLSEPLMTSLGNDRYPPSLILYNVQGGWSKKLEPNFPNILNIDHNVEWENNGLTLYDPTMTRVVYGYGTGEEGSSYRIWDLLTNGLIKAISTEGWTPGNPPRWSQDGTRFILSLNQNGPNLYDFSRDGEKQQLTFFENILNPGYVISHYVWSPDNRNIAFYVRPFNSDQKEWGEFQLALYNLDTKRTFFPCIIIDSDGSAIGSFSGDPEEPIWSPDSSMILIEQRYATEKSQLVVIDLHKSQIYMIDHNKKPLAWLNWP